MQSENIEQFAEKVEALCGHLLSSVDKNGEPDVAALQDLQKEAGDIATGVMFPERDPLKGLAEVLR